MFYQRLPCRCIYHVVSVIGTDAAGCSIRKKECSAILPASLRYCGLGVKYSGPRYHQRLYRLQQGIKVYVGVPISSKLLRIWKESED